MEQPKKLASLCMIAIRYKFKVKKLLKSLGKEQNEIYLTNKNLDNKIKHNNERIKKICQFINMEYSKKIDISEYLKKK